MNTLSSSIITSSSTSHRSSSSTSNAAKPQATISATTHLNTTDTTLKSSPPSAGVTPKTTLTPSSSSTTTKTSTRSLDSSASSTIAPRHPINPNSLLDVAQTRIPSSLSPTIDYALDTRSKLETSPGRNPQPEPFTPSSPPVPRYQSPDPRPRSLPGNVNNGPPPPSSLAPRTFATPITMLNAMIAQIHGSIVKRMRTGLGWDAQSLSKPLGPNTYAPQSSGERFSDPHARSMRPRPTSAAPSTFSTPITVIGTVIVDVYGNVARMLRVRQPASHSSAASTVSQPDINIPKDADAPGQKLTHPRAHSLPGTFNNGPPPPTSAAPSTFSPSITMISTLIIDIHKSIMRVLRQRQADTTLSNTRELQTFDHQQHPHWNTRSLPGNFNNGPPPPTSAATRPRPQNFATQITMLYAMVRNVEGSVVSMARRPQSQPSADQPQDSYAPDVARISGDNSPRSLPGNFNNGPPPPNGAAGGGLGMPLTATITMLGGLIAGVWAMIA